MFVHPAPAVLHPPEAFPIVKTPEMLRLEAEIDAFDRDLVGLKDRFLRSEQQHNDIMDDLEAEFGKELERLRRQDLHEKGLIQRKLAEAMSRDEEVLTADLTPRSIEAAWVERKAQLDQEYRDREEQTRRNYQGRIEQLEADLQTEMRRLQELERDEDAAIPYLGLDLVEHSSGVKVSKARGPAKDAGIREGDLILNIQASKNIKSRKTLSEIALHAQPGEHLAFLVERDGVELETVISVPTSMVSDAGWGANAMVI